MTAIEELLQQVQDASLRERLKKEIDRLTKHKKYGLVYEEHIPECTPLFDFPISKGSIVGRRDSQIKEVFIVESINNDVASCRNLISKEDVSFHLSEIVAVARFGDAIYPTLTPISSICNAPNSDLWHALIQADNYLALQLLAYLYPHQVDCIYIDPPYNTGAKDWKYNNDYVDSSDSYRHSKWLSMMEKRLRLANEILNPNNSVLIVTIDEKEYLHLGCLLEELFPSAQIQMITDVINPRGTNRENEFSRVEEYIFVCRLGNASICKADNNMLGNTDEVAKSRVWYAFNRGNNLKTSAPAQFFPIYIDERTRTIKEVGNSLGINASQTDYPIIDGLTAVFPINSYGEESIWRAIPETTRKWINSGYVKVSQFDDKNNRWTLSYIPSGLQEKIERGEIVSNGKNADGSLNISKEIVIEKKVNPRSVWYQKYHNATDYGAALIKSMMPNHAFSYPKSLYSVLDTIRFFVADKPNALIVDFFAGSGTTLQAVNLLNTEDGGHRRCILVTNNEISEEEEKSLKARGYNHGDEEWERLGIARYVTWPRTVCSITGKDINGNPLVGTYCNLTEGKGRPMSDGFNTNAIFFKINFLNKNSVALGRQFMELLPLLWMKAGGVGTLPIIEGEIPPILILPQNKMAILVKTSYSSDFVKKINANSEIDHVFIVTDSQNEFSEIASQLNAQYTSQLYRDYLDNFRINTNR